MGLCLELQQESRRCISLNSLKRFRNAFIGRHRSRPASLSTAAGQQRPKIRLFWQKSSPRALLSSPASRLLSVISARDGSRQRQKDAHRHGKRFMGRRHENDKSPINQLNEPVHSPVPTSIWLLVRQSSVISRGSLSACRER